LLNAYAELTQAFQHKNIVMLVGPHDTGKSGLMKLLQESGRIALRSICPNAYSMQDLYGREDLNGVICCLIEQTIKNLKH
jgi:ABC-type ATPase involved in cell division